MEIGNIFIIVVLISWVIFGIFCYVIAKPVKSMMVNIRELLEMAKENSKLMQTLSWSELNLIISSLNIVREHGKNENTKKAFIKLIKKVEKIIMGYEE